MFLNWFKLDFKKNDVSHILAYSKIFISDSTTMCVEAAMLGVPSIECDDWYGDFKQYDLGNDNIKIFSSPLGRAKHSAYIILDTLKIDKKQIIFDDRLKQKVANGDWTHSKPTKNTLKMILRPIFTEQIKLGNIHENHIDKLVTYNMPVKESLELRTAEKYLDIVRKLYDV